jgi:hypothetical protein
MEFVVVESYLGFYIHTFRIVSHTNCSAAATTTKATYSF